MTLPNSRRRNFLALGALISAIGVVALLATAGTAEARHRRVAHRAPHMRAQYVPSPYREPQFGYYPGMKPCFSLDDCDRKAFDESGTRGRMGLGADPAHPEGPGNFSD